MCVQKNEKNGWCRDLEERGIGVFYILQSYKKLRLKSVLILFLIFIWI